MKLEAWEPDLRTLVMRVDEGEIDLQPEFQRGSVWGPEKQKRLIDTLLRNWSIPPLHLLVLEDESMVVLDGQQRLRALHAFINNNIRIDSFPPHDPFVSDVKGMRFKDLTAQQQRRVNNYKVIAYKLYEYEPEEPYELFFRLNLPTGLTQAEKRNALFGPSREQLRNLVKEAEGAGWDANLVGFSNSRMAYDDILARACLCIEQKSLRTPLTASNLEQRYRDKEGFSDTTISVIGASIQSLTNALRVGNGNVRLNKATLLTWLLIVARVHLYGISLDLERAINYIESSRGALKRRSFDQPMPIDFGPIDQAYLSIYSDRASLRVTDVMSVVSRDALAWRIIVRSDLTSNSHVSQSTARLFAPIERTLVNEQISEDTVEQRLFRALEIDDSWGDLA